MEKLEKEEQKVLKIEEHEDWLLKELDRDLRMMSTFGENKKRSSFSEVLPKDTIGLITTFLTDEDLFSIRSTNKIFYQAYRDQRVTRDTIFCHSRAIYMASCGYIFKHVTYLRVLFGDIDLLQFINPQNFPKLKTLDSSLLREMPLNPNITTVITWINKLPYLTVETFPNLLHAEIHMGDVPDAEVLPVPHPNLRSLFLTFDLIMESEAKNDLSLISREYFPKLELLKIYEAYDPDYRIQQMLEIGRLRKEGVCVTELKPVSWSRAVSWQEENYIAM